MKIKNKILLFLSVIFLFLTLGAWTYAEYIDDAVNEEWGKKFTQRQLLFDKYRTLLPILREVNIAAEMAKDPEVIAFAKDDTDPKRAQKGIEALESYRLRFADRSYFAAFKKSERYYFNDYANQYANKQYVYTLSKFNKDDKWFYDAMKVTSPYQINVNKDTLLGTTKVWINFLLKDGNETVGIVGTGLDLTQFLKESVAIEQKGVRNILINKEMAIQLERDTRLIDYASLTKNTKEHKTLSLILKNSQEVKRIKEAMDAILGSAHHDETMTLWVDFDGKRELLGIAYIPELEWFSISVINEDELSVLDNTDIFIVLTLFFLLTIAIINYLHNRLLLRPLAQLKESMASVEYGDYDATVEVKGEGEIAELAMQFAKMLEVIKEYHYELEERVALRTKELEESEEKLHTILDNVGAYIFIKDSAYRYIYANRQVRSFFGRSLEEIIGEDDSLFFDADAFKVIRQNDQKVIEGGRETRDEEIVYDKAGRIKLAYSTVKVPLFNAKGEVYALCGISTDITKAKLEQEEINRLAFYDPLTKIPNRRLMNDRLAQTVALCRRTGTYGALLFADLDNFKPLNDNYGHDAGDLLLIEVANRLKHVVREVDTVARYGGDEFVVIVSELSNARSEAHKQAEQIAAKMLSRLMEPFVVMLPSKHNSIEYVCGASIGVVLFSDDKEHEEILRYGDIAMYKAKEAGRAQVVFYEES